MLEQVLGGNSLQRWLIAAGIIVAGLILGRLITGLIRALVGRLRSSFLGVVAGGIGGPITTLIVVIAVRIAVESLKLPSGVSDLVNKGVILASVLCITWLGANGYDSLHNGVFVPYARRPSSSIDLHLISILRTIVNVLIWMVGIVSGLNSVGFQVSAILAGLGIGGMALALAAQDTVANFFGGLLILTQRPFKVGDRIEVAGVNGWVHQLGLRNTIIKNWYGRDVLVPNKKFTDSIVTNIDSQAVYFQEARLCLDPRTTAAEIEQALAILGAIVKDVELLDKTPWILFDKIDHGFFEIEFWYAIPRWSAKESAQIPNEYEKICRAKTQVNLEILRRFQAAQIRLAVPVEMQLKP